MRRSVALELVQIAQDLVSLVTAHVLGADADDPAAPDAVAEIARTIARLDALRAAVTAEGLAA